MLGILAKALVVNHLVAALYNRVKTAASSGVAGWPRLVDLYQNAVAVTVKADLHNLLNMTACGSFDPKFLSGLLQYVTSPESIVRCTLSAFIQASINTS